MLVVKNVDGSVVSDKSYPVSLPQHDSKVYALTTEGIRSVLTDKVSDYAGQLRLRFVDNAKIIVEDPSGQYDIRPINGSPSHHNQAKLLQDRKLYLNYMWNNGDGTSTYVTDTLYFRNRVRDGMSEWQDENPEHYK